MKTYSPRAESIPSTRLLYSLMQERPAVEKLVAMGKVYEPLLRLMLAWPAAEKQPTGKALQQQLGINSAVYRRWLEIWSADFWELAQAEDTGFLDFSSVEHVFELHHPEQSVWFRCRLAVTPRVGEAVELPFVLRRYWSTYYVDAVQHAYRNGRTEISIILREGRYNSHLHYLRHKARFEHDYWTVDQGDDFDVKKYFQEQEKRKNPAAAYVTAVRNDGRGRSGR
ncbi:hypothetical protein [Hymenobacter negativus]|uniref:Transposase n=1 Tax=Hymenobacter negativus TaxID=2795026 RepID=A0ABS0Q5H0_9BACT|nr:hypothetical protein [Hymenobacter negativus]MBH8557903.1 hypothetical protein [Hymenobacter negativus]